MKKPEDKSAADKKRVQGYISKWADVLFLSHWSWEVGYMPQDDGEKGTLADIEAQPEYLSARIRIFPCFWTLSAERQERTIVHELCHAVISPVSGAYEDLMDGNHVSQTSFGKLNEATTQHIANIILSLHK